MGRHEDAVDVSVHGLHEAAETEAEASAAIAGVVGSPKFWLAPLLLVITLMSFMAALYMGAVVNPQGNLHDFKIALVNEDTGAEVDAGGGKTIHENFGNQVADGIISSAAENGIVMQKTDRTAAMSDLGSGKVYGVVAIESDFSNRAVSLGQATVIPNKPNPPTINVYFNRGSGTFASSITTTFAQEMDTQVNQQFGEQLTATVRTQLDQLNEPFSGAAQLALASPVKVDVIEPAPLPDGSANGLSAFYFTLLLVLAGFTGAMMVSILVDGMLGQTPIEFGPLYQLRERLAISRWGTLAAKWTIMVLVAMTQSALFIGVSSWVGSSMPNAFTLWMFSVLSISAVGITASSVMAVFGNPGLLLNLIFFVIFGLPSSGGTVPLEASPKIFEWIAAVEPMHIIYLGVRSILYFDADLSAGLSRAIIQCFVGLLIGGLLGWAGTKFYDREGWHRYAGGMTPPAWVTRAMQ